MCGVFRLPETDEMLLRLERVYAGKALLSRCILEGNAYPGNILPVIARGKSGAQGAYLMEWGFHMKGSYSRIINARSETAAKKPLFAAAMQHRRCLIPMAHYYEWKRDDGEKQKFSFTPASPGPHYLAGIYQYEQDPILPAFTILTRSAEKDIAFIHNRMPVMFSGEAAERWLTPDTDPVPLLQQALKLMDISSCA